MTLVYLKHLIQMIGRALGGPLEARQVALSPVRVTRPAARNPSAQRRPLQD